MERPELSPFEFSALNGHAVITMSEGQWDTLLAIAYDTGWILLELDANEQPLRSYRKPNVHAFPDRRALPPDGPDIGSDVPGGGAV